MKRENSTSVAGIADETKREANSVQPKVQAMTGMSQEAQSRQPETPVMDLYDLFGYTQKERRLAERGLKPGRKKGGKSKPKQPVQASLFVLPEDGTEMKADSGKTEAGAAITPEEAKEMEEIIRDTAEVEAAPVETAVPKAEDTKLPYRKPKTRHLQRRTATRRMPFTVAWTGKRTHPSTDSMK